MTSEDLKKALDREKAYSKDVKEACIHLNHLIATLDEAMATEERIAEDIQRVGGFVSGLDLTETADEIVERAILVIKGAKQLLTEKNEKAP